MKLGLAPGIPVVSVQVHSLRPVERDAPVFSCPCLWWMGLHPLDQVCPGERLPGKQDLLWEAGRLAVCPPSWRSGSKERKRGRFLGRASHSTVSKAPLPPLPKASLHSPDPMWEGRHRLCFPQ